MKILSAKLKFTAACLAFLSFFSCAANINGVISPNGSADINISLSLGQRITTLIRSFSAAGGKEAERVLDGASITRSMSNAPGISLVTFRNTSASAVEGRIVISHISEFLSSGGQFITFQQNSSGGRCVININRENASVILGNLSPEINDYLTAILAPIAIDDEMTKTEYLALVASFYNKAVSDEIASSRIRASIDFPANVKTVKGGTFSGRRAVFDIPLLDILVLETPLVYEVNW